MPGTGIPLAEDEEIISVQPADLLPDGRLVLEY